MKTAYLAFPHYGGTFTVFRHLRLGLEPKGIELRWIGSGARQSARLDPEAWRDEMPHGTLVAPLIEDDRARAAALIEHLESAGYDLVFVNVLSDRAQTNAMRYLTPRIRRVMIVHNITVGTYAAARAVRDHVHATIAVSPRIRDDLVAKVGFPRSRTYAVPNAVDSFCLLEREPRPDGPLRLLLLGRVEDASKGALWLPAILRALSDVPLTLTVAGGGPDLGALRRRLRSFGDRASVLGMVPAKRIPALLARHDVLVFPSRYEGFPMALVEAMAAGCVPVASCIRGVTDFAVDHGRTGFLFPIGDVRGAAAAIRRLASDRLLLARLSREARDSVEERFGIAAMANAYAEVIEAALRAPPDIAPPLELCEWTYPSGLRRGLRSHLPTPVKNVLRQWRERVA